MATEIYLGYPPENIKKWIKEEAERKYQEMLKTPLTFTAEEAGSTVKMHKWDSAPTVYLETSPTGEEGSWSDFIVNSTTITLTNVGDKVYFRAKQDNLRFSTGGFRSSNIFVIKGKIAASGNINTLLKADGSILDLTGRDHCYNDMFSNCSLTQAPTLPATTLADYCYQGMFSYCSLTQAPELPATILAESCYDSMFRGCTSLTKAPELPATTLASSCYWYMFEGCISLTQAPELPATELASGCYSSMFHDCTSLTKAPSKLPATELASGCYYEMFCGCTSLTQAPELSTVELNLSDDNYANMFWRCKSPFTFSDKTFDEIAILIQEQYLIGEGWYDENGEIINPIEIICSDKTMLATFDENEWTWTLTEK